MGRALLLDRRDLVHRIRVSLVRPPFVRRYSIGILCPSLDGKSVATGPSGSCPPYSSLSRAAAVCSEVLDRHPLPESGWEERCYSTVGILSTVFESLSCGRRLFGGTR